MSESRQIYQPKLSSLEQIFPSLSPSQMERIARYGRIRKVERGEVLIQPGLKTITVFVVKSGELEFTQSSETDEKIVGIVGPGQFTGEANVLFGRPGLIQIRVSEPGELIELDRNTMMSLLQTDSELSDIFMRAFILRREELIAGNFGDVVLLGSTHSPDTLRIKEFLTRNNQAYSYIDLDRDTIAQELLDRFQIAVNEVPVVLCRGNIVLRNPENAKTARHVHLMFRNDDLSERMSRYLIARIEKHPKIEIHPHKELIALEGEDHLEVVRFRDKESHKEESHALRHLFVMTGAIPNTQWLGNCVVLDSNGFIKTGNALSKNELATANWPLSRTPGLLETSQPGVFAVGDVRSGSIKRVASAVGEGSIAISLVHQVLNE